MKFFRSYNVKEKYYCSLVTKDLTNLATAEESYYIDKNEYLGKSEYGAPALSEDDYKALKLSPSGDVSMAVVENFKVHFVAYGIHPRCSQGYMWDSSKGGLVPIDKEQAAHGITGARLAQ